MCDGNKRAAVEIAVQNKRMILDEITENMRGSLSGCGAGAGRGVSGGEQKRNHRSALKHSSAVKLLRLVFIKLGLGLNWD